MCFNHDITGSRQKIYTGQEKVTGNFGAVVDGLKGIGDCGTGASSQAGNMVYGAMWSGAAGEMSDANIKLLLVAMGFTIPWS